MSNRIVGEGWIQNTIQSDELLLNANSQNRERNTFEFIVDKISIPVSMIASLGKNKIRVFRGYGEKVAQQRPQNAASIFNNIEGEKTIEIIVYDAQENVADRLQFKAKIRRGLDSEMYGFRMETVVIETINL